MKLSMRICLLAMTLSLSGVYAADSAEMSADDKKKADALIKDLGADEFQTRESAEKGLAALGGAVLPLVKTTAANTSDAEIRTRCERVIKVLALEVEKDPVVLAKMGKELALAKNFADAAKYYSKAAQIFKEEAAKPENEKTKSDLLTKQKRATDRMARAEMMAKAGDNNGADAQIMVGGGVAVRQRIVIRAGGVVVDESSEDGDW